MSTTNEQLIQLDFAEEMKNSFRDYALSVIIARALPDVRDGLKPVQRRILYAMDQLNLDPKKPHRKSARIVGDTMGKFHPHGDSSIYEALVHMTEEYSLSIPLVDGHGNFGSIDGDGAAAMRYTEARLSEGAMALLRNLDKKLVDFIPNFDESEQEPTVLPAMIPNLLINGTTGIAVGMATNIPPHNAGEVIDGTIALIDNPALSVEELMQYIPGPDFPTGGTIVNAEVIPQIYATGEGRLRVRAKTVLEKGDNGKTNIVITEIPFTVAGNKTKLVEGLSGLMRDKVFEEISDVRDESSKEGIRIVIEVKKDRDVENLLNGLYKKTLMEDTYAVNLLAVKEKQPIVFSLKSMLNEFIAFQEILYTREYTTLLGDAKTRLEKVEGLVRAVDIIDLIIEVLRGSSTRKQAKECLMHGDITDIKFKSETSRMMAFKLDFSELQAEAILSMQLASLIGLEINKLYEERDDLNARIEDYTEILSKRSRLHSTIKKRLGEYKKQFERVRRTTLDTIAAANYVVEEKVEDNYILIDKFGYTKCIDESAYSRAAAEALKEYRHIVKLRSNDKLCIFTAEGNMLQVKASAIPKCKLKDKGTLIHNLCKMDNQDPIRYAAFEDLFEAMVMFVTADGFVKCVSGAEFETGRYLIAATKLDDNDKVVNIILLTAGEYLAGLRKVIIYTKAGLSLGFKLGEVQEYKKTSRGTQGIKLDKGDRVVYADVIMPEEETFEFNGKVLSAKKIKVRSRGAKGQKADLKP